jgi:hypothetical protein
MGVNRGAGARWFSASPSLGHFSAPVSRDGGFCGNDAAKSALRAGSRRNWQFRCSLWERQRVTPDTRSARTNLRQGSAYLFSLSCTSVYAQPFDCASNLRYTAVRATLRDAPVRRVSAAPPASTAAATRSQAQAQTLFCKSSETGRTTESGSWGKWKLRLHSVIPPGERSRGLVSICSAMMVIFFEILRKHALCSKGMTVFVEW